MATISTHVGHTISEEHNLRDEKHTSKDGHIDPSRTPLNETICYQPIKDAYHDLFDASVAEYNAKQTRADRCIDDYYKKICESKQKHPAYEMIIGVYNKTDKGKVIEAEREFSDEVGKEIMKEFVAGWAERNPNLHMTGAHYHADEDGQPHIHIDFIPVIDNCARGIRRQTAFDKALQRQGFKKKEAVYEFNEDGSQKLDENNKPIQKQAWSTPQMQWEASENKALEDLCLARGLTVEHPDRDAGGRRHEHTDDYKQSKDELRELQEQIAKEQEAQRQEAERHAAELRRLREEHERQLEKEKKEAEKKLAEERKAHDEQLKFEYENHAEELQRQRREQKEQLAQEWEDTKNAEKAAIRADLANLRTEVFREINEDRRKAEADLQDFKKHADSEKNDIEKDLTRLKLEKSSSEAETAEKKNSLSVVKASLAAANYSIKFAEEAEILPVKPWYSSKLQIGIGDWEKWNNNYRKMRDWWLSNGEKAKKLEGEKSDLQKAVSRKDQKIEDMTEIIKQKNETIAELKKEIAEKDEKISALEKTVTLIKSGFSKALAWFSVKVPDDVSPKLGDAAQDLAERDKFQEFELGEKVAACKITVMEDSLGIFGLLEEEGTGRQRIMSKDDLLSATNGFEGNDVKGNWVKLEGFELTEENSFNRYPQKVADYEFGEKQEKSSDGGGGMVLGSKLKEKLLQLEKERTVGD